MNTKIFLHCTLGVRWGEAPCDLLHGWLQRLHLCLRPDRLWEDIHHGGNISHIDECEYSY